MYRKKNRSYYIYIYMYDISIKSHYVPIKWAISPIFAAEDLPKKTPVLSCRVCSSFCSSRWPKRGAIFAHVLRMYNNK